MRTSYSALNTFLQCPLKYKFQEIDRIRTPKGKDAIFGTVIHNTLKFIHQPGRLAPLTLQDILKYFESNWNKDLFPSPYDEQTLFARGKNILEKYYKENDIFKASPIALEMFFEAPVEDHVLAGKIDRIDKTADGGFEIIDYKTSRQLPSQEAIDNDMQLAIYQIGFLKKWPQFDRQIKISLYFLQHGIKLSSSKNPGDIEETKEKILDIIKSIEETKEKNDFKPLPGPLCDWCGYQKQCPMFSHKFKEQIAQEDIDIQKVLSKFYNLKESETETKKQLAELKEKINQYCDSQKVERIFSDDGSSVVRSTQQRFDYDWTIVEDVLKSAEKWEKVFAPDKTKLEKLMPTLSQDNFKKIKKTRKVESEFKVIRVEKSKTSS